jgi:agmatine deiminase
LEIHTLPQPRPQKRDDGRRLTLSYVNFYIANGGIVMPAFGDPADSRAFKTISQVFGNRHVVQLDVLDLLHGGGGIHCVTQQQPAVG